MKFNAKGRLVLIATLLASISPSPARADIWGGDVVVLTQILIQTIQQLLELRAILANGKDTFDLMRSINEGINDSLNLMRTISPDRAPGIYADWQKADQALQAIQSLYGIVAPSKDARIQGDADQSAAEAIALNNSVYAYTAQIDEIGERVKENSHLTSPGGAQKLTAQTLGVVLNVMNQNLRTEATGLKLQAQALAIQNRKDKEASARLVSDVESLKTSMQTERADFSLPRF